MKRSKRYYHILVTTVALALLAAPGATAGVPAPAAVTRTLEPVVVTGQELPQVLGAPVAQIFVYAYHGGSWAQLPAQVDEVDASGAYVAFEDGLLDGNDELVFMARDLGDSSGGAAPEPADGTLVISWYEVTVTDPTHPADQGWAYVVRSASIVPTPTDDYVHFDGPNHRIIGSNYTLGFATPKAWLSYMALGTSGPDILDRLPKLRFCKVICFTEEVLPDIPDGLVKDGPVRAILREGRVVAYGWTLLSIIPTTLPFAPNFVRFSTDFNADAVWSTFYNAAVPGGVTVDGLPDDVPPEPFSSWTQLSYSTGTMVQVYDVSEMAGTPTNYYVDNSQIDTQDTGDQRHYGDAGVRVDQPNLSFTFRTRFYFLDGSQDNVGEMYAGYAAQPLQSAAEWQELDLPNHLYVPLVLR